MITALDVCSKEMLRKKEEVPMSRLSILLVIGAITLIGILPMVAIAYVLITNSDMLIDPYLTPVSTYPWFYIPLM